MKIRIRLFTGGTGPRALMRAKLIVLALVTMAVLGGAETMRGAGQYLTVDYPGSAATNELQTAVTYTLWIPAGVAQLRGIIVHQHGAGTTASKEGSTAAYDLRWQALAKKWDCALFSSSYHVLNEKTDLTPGGSEDWFDPRRGSEKTFLRALHDFAVKSGHPEVDAVPWALWGHSGGGIWSDVMTTLYPDRVIAVWMRSGSALMFLTHPEFARPDVPAALYKIPMMTNPGVKEKPKLNPDAPDNRTEEEKMKGPWLGNIATFKAYRAKGGLIGFAPDPRTGHECGDSRYLAIPFFDACLAMRLPDKGSKDEALKPMDMSQAWMAALMSEEAQPAAAFKGDPNTAVWLPNAAVAKAWMEYVKTGAVSDTTPPPAPSRVKVTDEGEQGTEITWEAEADFESGIRAFIILRDGQEVAQVPEKPVGKFGRPLFQSMTYHDTPDQPMPAMRYVDASAKAGEKHSYSVVTVNSVGLKSEPSSPSPPITAAAQGWGNPKGMDLRSVIEHTLRPYQGESHPGVNTRTLTGKVMCGYQGWFAAPTDGGARGWTHWGGRNGFKPGSCCIDLWPDVSELDSDERFATQFRQEDGRPAEVFSPFNRKTVLRHFKWMQDCGIDGVFVQRFINDVSSSRGARHFNVVLDHCREGANLFGRTYAVMYDLSGMGGGQMERVMGDWKALVDHMQITKDPAYLNHAGKPVVTLWGFGFSDGRRYTPTEGLELVKFLKDDPRYGGCTVMLGVPAYWRTLDRDCVKDPVMHQLILKADIVSPWTVGRYTTPAQARRYAESTLKQDLEWCKEHGKDYLPVVFPGFSWHNMNPGSPLNQIPRLKGKFLWTQFVQARKAGATMVYQAMFDEVNEGTAIFKCTNKPPVGASAFVTYEGLPSDFYMRLVGHASRMLRGQAPVTDDVPALSSLVK